jgi:protein-arginine kinase activator protein McsA
MAIRHEQESYEQQYLMAELESLGLSTIRLNEFNDNRELRGLVKGIVAATTTTATIATTTVAIEEYGVCSYCGKQFEEMMGSCRRCGAGRKGLS